MGAAGETAGVAEQQDNMTKTNLTISGMHCESCAKIIEMELGDQSGVDNIKVNYNEHSAVIEYDQEKISIEKIIEIIDSLGYQTKEI